MHRPPESKGQPRTATTVEANAASKRIHTPPPHIYGSPGARPRGLGLLKSLWPIGLILFAMGYLVRTAYPHPQIPYWLNSLLFLAVAVGIAATANAARQKIGNHAKGARGEELAARALATLPPDYCLFHGLTIQGGIRDLEGGADIDHVVVAPQVVFTIETKHWHGDLTIQDGQLLQDNILPDRDPIEQTRTAAQRINRFLEKNGLPPVPVIPVLLFSTSAARRLPQDLRGVMLTDLQHLTQRLQAYDAPIMDPGIRQTIVECLARQVEP